MASERAHGTLAKYTEEGCRCELCRGVIAAWTRHKTRMLAYGRWQPYVDAEPVRAHVKALMAYGIGWQRVADLAKVPRGSVSRLLYGAAEAEEPSKRVRPRTAERLLAVKAVPENLGRTTAVDATGTRRRLQALVAIGWSQRTLAGRLGMYPHAIGDITQGREKVAAGTAVAVRKLFAEMWTVLPPETTPRERLAADRARKMAHARGWVSPMAWDSDEIDDPDAVPQVGEDPSRLSVIVHYADKLTSGQGLTVEQAAERLGVRGGYLRYARGQVRQREAVNA